MDKILAISLTFLVVACASPQVYTGRVTDCEQIPISGYEVRAFKNGWVPLTLPPEVGTAISEDDGRFIIRAEDKPDFLILTGKAEVTIVDHPNLSERQCP